MLNHILGCVLVAPMLAACSTSRASIPALEQEHERRDVVSAQQALRSEPSPLISSNIVFSGRSQPPDLVVTIELETDKEVLWATVGTATLGAEPEAFVLLPDTMSWQSMRPGDSGRPGEHVFQSSSSVRHAPQRDDRGYVVVAVLVTRDHGVTELEFYQRWIPVPSREPERADLEPLPRTTH